MNFLKNEETKYKIKLTLNLISQFFNSNLVHIVQIKKNKLSLILEAKTDNNSYYNYKSFKISKKNYNEIINNNNYNLLTKILKRKFDNLNKIFITKLEFLSNNYFLYFDYKNKLNDNELNALDNFKEQIKLINNTCAKKNDLINDLEKKEKDNQMLKEEKYITSSILDSIPGNIVILDNKGKIVYTNHSWEKFALNNQGDLNSVSQGVNYLEVCKKAANEGDENALKAYKGIKAVMKKEKKEFSLEYPCHSPQKKRWFRMYASSYQGIGPLNTVIIHNDITEKVLKERKEKSILDNLPVMISRFNNENNLSYINQEIPNFFNKSKKEILNNPKNIELNKVFYNKWKKSLENIFNNGKKVKFETTIAKDNEKNYLLNYLIPEFEDKKVSSVIALTIDITEERKIRNNLLEQKIHYKQLFNNSPLAIVLLDENEKIIKSNKGFEKLFSYENDEIKGKAINQLIIHQSKSDQKYLEIDLETESFAAEKIRYTKDGKEIDVEITTFPVLLHNNKMGSYVLYKDISERKKTERELKKTLKTEKRYNELKGKYTDSLITVLTKILELHDKYTKGQSDSVANLTVKMTKKLELSEEKINTAYWTALVHDIGKINIPSQILNKISSLTVKEYNQVQSHPVLGYKILNETEELNEVATNVLYHHEHWDGSGYPEGLKKEEIPLISRIINIADAWVAMRSKRAYRNALSEKEAIKELIKNKGKQFDPNLVDIFMKIISGGEG
ncbi:MAG: HD domain-containing phosphohydrolase [Bacillota bacterium]